MPYIRTATQSNGGSNKRTLSASTRTSPAAATAILSSATPSSGPTARPSPPVPPRAFLEGKHTTPTKVKTTSAAVTDVPSTTPTVVPRLTSPGVIVPPPMNVTTTVMLLNEQVERQASLAAATSVQRQRTPSADTSFVTRPPAPNSFTRNSASGGAAATTTVAASHAAPSVSITTDGSVSRSTSGELTYSSLPAPRTVTVVKQRRCVGFETDVLSAPTVPPPPQPIKVSSPSKTTALSAFTTSGSSAAESKMEKKETKHKEAEEDKEEVVTVKAPRRSLGLSPQQRRARTQSEKNEARMEVIGLSPATRRTTLPPSLVQAANDITESRTAISVPHLPPLQQPSSAVISPTHHSSPSKEREKASSIAKDTAPASIPKEELQKDAPTPSHSSPQPRRVSRRRSSPITNSRSSHDAPPVTPLSAIQTREMAPRTVLPVTLTASEVESSAPVDLPAEEKQEKAEEREETLGTAALKVKEVASSSAGMPAISASPVMAASLPARSSLAAAAAASSSSPYRFGLSNSGFYFGGSYPIRSLGSVSERDFARSNTASRTGPIPTAGLHSLRPLAGDGHRSAAAAGSNSVHATLRSSRPSRPTSRQKKGYAPAGKTDSQAAPSATQGPTDAQSTSFDGDYGFSDFLTPGWGPSSMVSDATARPLVGAMASVDHVRGSLTSGLFPSGVPNPQLHPSPTKPMTDSEPAFRLALPHTRTRSGPLGSLEWEYASDAVRDSISPASSHRLCSATAAMQSVTSAGSVSSQAWSGAQAMGSGSSASSARYRATMGSDSALISCALDSPATAEVTGGSTSATEEGGGSPAQMAASALSPRRQPSSTELPAAGTPREKRGRAVTAANPNAVSIAGRHNSAAASGHEEGEEEDGLEELDFLSFHGSGSEDEEEQKLEDTYSFSSMQNGEQGGTGGAAAEEAELDRLLDLAEENGRRQGTLDCSGVAPTRLRSRRLRRRRHMMPLAAFRHMYAVTAFISETAASLSYQVRERRTGRPYTATLVFADAATAPVNKKKAEGSEMDGMSAELTRYCAMSLLLDHPHLLRTTALFYRDVEDATRVAAIVRACTAASRKEEDTWEPELTHSEAPKVERPAVSLQVPGASPHPPGTLVAAGQSPLFVSLLSPQEVVSVAAPASPYAPPPPMEPIQEKKMPCVASESPVRVASTPRPVKALPRARTETRTRRNSQLMKRWFPSLFHSNINDGSPPSVEAGSNPILKDEDPMEATVTTTTTSSSTSISSSTLPSSLTKSNEEGNASTLSLSPAKPAPRAPVPSPPERQSRQKQLASLLANGRTIVILISELLQDVGLRDGASVLEVAERGAGLPIPDLIRVTRDVADALDYLHSFRLPCLSLAHGAVSPRGLLIAQDGVLRMAHSTELGWVPREGKRREMPTVAQIARAAPGLVPAADMYAFGLTLLELATGLSAQPSWELLRTGQLWLPSPELRHLLLGLLRDDAVVRLTAEAVLRHPFLTTPKTAIPAPPPMPVQQQPSAVTNETAELVRAPVNGRRVFHPAAARLSLPPAWRGPPVMDRH